jgi:hypothetical protein
VVAGARHSGAMVGAGEGFQVKYVSDFISLCSRSGQAGWQVDDQSAVASPT